MPFTIPTQCEYCGSTLVDSDTELYCPNPECPEVIKHRIAKWISVQDINFIGDSTLDKMVLHANVRKIKDLYKLDADYLNQCTAIGEQMATKIVNEIEKKKVIPIHKFVSGFDIDGVGRRTIKSIVKFFGLITIEEFFQTIEAREARHVPGIGDKLEGIIYDGIHTHYDDMIELLDYVKVRETTPSSMAPLAGQVICITGKIEGTTRMEVIEHIMAWGGDVTDHVTKNTTLLVTDSTEKTTKMRAAEKNGVKIISSKDLFAIR